MNSKAFEFASLVAEEAEIAKSAASMFAAESDDLFAGGSGGWFGVGLPESVGGAGGAMSQLAPVLEAGGAALAASCLPWTTGIVGRLLVGANGEVGRFISRISEGEFATCVPALGCARTATELSSTDSDSPISGSVLALGPETGVLAVPLLLKGEQSLVLVSATDAGVTADAVHGMDPTRAWSRFTLDTVRPERLPKVSVPDLFTRWQMATGTVFGLDSAGAARTALGRTVEYAGLRRQFGRSLASFQAYKHKCASALVELKLAQSVAYRSARFLGESGSAEATGFSLSAAVQSTVSATSVCADAVQLHGGIGFSQESGIHLYLRRCRANEILAGGEDVERALLQVAVGSETIHVNSAT